MPVNFVTFHQLQYDGYKLPVSDEKYNSSQLLSNLSVIKTSE